MKPPTLNVFIGFDSKEPLTWAVCAYSLLKRASIPVAIHPLALNQLGRIYTRPRGATESTEFSITRFLTPYLSNFTGLSVFMDSDMLVQADVAELLLYPLAYPEAAVFCCQHDYTPRSATKFDGHQQLAYPRKNWSSFLLFVNERCQMLTPDYVNRASGLDLHRFRWLPDNLLGAMPLSWNWLVGEYPPNDNAQVLHFTEGAPCFEAYTDCDHADLWFKEYGAMLAPVNAMRFRSMKEAV